MRNNKWKMRVHIRKYKGHTEPKIYMKIKLLARRSDKN